MLCDTDEASGLSYVTNPHAFSCACSIPTRRFGSDIQMNSASEIEWLFKRLSDPLYIQDATMRLSKIASRQTFMMPTYVFDVIFSTITKLKGQVPSANKKVPLSQSFMNSTVYKHRGALTENRQNSSLVIQLLNLVDKIASFPSYCLVNGLRNKHLSVLLKTLPNQSAAKALGKFIALDEEYCQFVLSVGLDPIFNLLNGQDALMIWFLGCFATFPSLNNQLMPYYEKYVAYSCVCQDLFVAKHAHDVIRILVSSSYEAREWFINHPVLQMLIQKYPTDEKTFFLFINTLIKLIDENNVKLFINTTGFIELLDAAFQTNNGDIIALNIRIISFIISAGYSHIMHEHSFDRYLYQICCENSTYQLKKETLRSLCYFIASLTASQQQEYLKYDFISVIREALELDDGDINTAGIQALSSLYPNAKSQNNEELLDVIEELVDIVRSIESEIAESFISLFE